MILLHQENASCPLVFSVVRGKRIPLFALLPTTNSYILFGESIHYSTVLCAIISQSSLLRLDIVEIMFYNGFVIA